MSPVKANAAFQIVGDVQRLALKPGDKIVITCPGRISVDQAKEFREQVERFFQGQHQVFVLGDGATLSVLEPTT